MGKQLFEFMTHWDSPRPIWFKRDEEALIGTQRSGGRPMPRIKPFDLVKGSTNLQGVRPPVLWQGQDGVIEAHTLGTSIDQLLERMQEAIGLWLEVNGEDSPSPPEPVVQ